MKNYSTLIQEIKQCESLDELEAGADIFDYGIEKGCYSQRQSKEFNTIYWSIKDRLIAKGISNKVKASNGLDLIYIVSKAPVNIKEDENKLVEYVNSIIKNLRGKQRIN